MKCSIVLQKYMQKIHVNRKRKGNAFISWQWQSGNQACPLTPGTLRTFGRISHI